MPTVSVIIPTIEGRGKLLERLLDSLPKLRQAVIVDGDLPLSAKRNHGALKAKGKYLLFCDDDNYLAPDAVSEAVKHMTPDVGVIGFVACYDSAKEKIADGGSIRNYFTGSTSDRFVNKNVSSLPQMPYEVDEVANCFLVRRQLWRKLGGFDEINFPIDLDEADFCRRAKKMGKKIMMCPTAICYHKSITYSRLPNFRRPVNAYMLPRNQLFYQRKHSNALSFIVFVAVFLPVRVCVYAAALIWHKKFSMIFHYLKGTWDGILGRRENKYF